MVKSIFSLLTVRQTSILSGATIIMFTLTSSKFLGLIRNRLLLHFFPPQSSDIFFAALQLPDLIFQLLIASALSVAFIPVFTEYLEREGKVGAFRLAQSVLSLSLIIFIFFSILIFIFAEQITSVMFSGFSHQNILEVVKLTRIILVGQILLTVGALFVGILQSFQRFIVPALAGVFYNIGVILGIIVLSPRFGIAGPAIGVIIGAILHVISQYLLVRSMGFRFTVFKLFHPGIREILGLTGIRSIGLAAEQINEKVAASLTSFLQSGSLTYLTLSQNLQLVPVNLFGTALAQAALPVLSSERARGRMEEFKVTLLTTLHQILFLALPATALLIVIRIPVVRLVYGAAQFDWEATVLTGKTVGFLAIGLAAQAVSLLLVRGFYALKDTKTPVIISFIVVAVNISQSFYFVRVIHLDVWSLGLAFSVTNILSVILLFWTLHFKVGGFNLGAVFSPLGKMLMATIIMGVALYIPIKLLDQVIVDTTRTINLIILTGLASVFALSVYVILVWFMKVKELETFISLAKRIILRLGQVRQAGPKLKSEEIIHGPDSV